MSRYSELRKNKPVLKVVKDAREVYFHMVSVMCDNKRRIKLKKNEDGDFKLSGMGYSLENYQMEYESYEIEWAADEGKWNEVFRMINSGVWVCEKVASR